jgi:hypothetical protein
MQYLISRHNVASKVTTWHLRDTCGRTNQSNQPRETGWLGNTNGVDVHAHGVFETTGEALRYIRTSERGRAAVRTSERVLEAYQGPALDVVAVTEAR